MGNRLHRDERVKIKMMDVNYCGGPPSVLKEEDRDDGVLGGCANCGEQNEI